MVTDNCFQKCGLKLKQINAADDVTELSIAKDYWGQQKAGVSYEEYVPQSNIVVSCEVQSSKTTMDEKFTTALEEDDGGKKETSNKIIVNSGGYQYHEQVTHNVWCQR